MLHLRALSAFITCSIDSYQGLIHEIQYKQLTSLIHLHEDDVYVSLCPGEEALHEYLRTKAITVEY